MVNIKANLTENFSWEEVTITQQRGIFNELPVECVPAVKFVAFKLEQIRGILGTPILISSWYRSPVLNKAVKGSKNSDHMLGAAVDFISPKYGTPLVVAKRLQKSALLLGFKQLIYEHSWVHISFNTTPGAVPRNEVLTLLEDGKYAMGILI
jgi:zinc D-Ala-D-Ala carboxypeptidase